MGVPDDAIAKAHLERALYQECRYGMIVADIKARKEHQHILANKVGQRVISCLVTAFADCL
jgi:hypothetical protein